MVRRRFSSLHKYTLPEISSPIMVSACLLGTSCRYDGRHSLCRELVDFTASIPYISFCPEELGGLSIPRSPANIVGGDGYDVLAGSARIIDVQGTDVTEAFIKGAYKALSLARSAASVIGIMKKRSPSCGLNTPYCDNPSGYGVGVTAALFTFNGIKVFELDEGDPFPSQFFLKYLEGRQKRS